MGGMRVLVTAIKNITEASCHAMEIKVGKCKINIANESKPWLVIDFDKSGAPIKQDNPRPDFLFVTPIFKIWSSLNYCQFIAESQK